MGIVEAVGSGGRRRALPAVSAPTGLTAKPLRTEMSGPKKTIEHRVPAWWMPADRHCALDHDLRRFYGMTCQEYEALYNFQGGVCYVCRKVPGKQRLAVDEDHSDRPVRIRGLAHRHCNRLIEEAQKVRHAL